MSTLAPLHPNAPWQHVDLGERFIAVAERSALGTTARVIVWPPHELPNALHAVDDQLSALDLQASRFRDDSEISQVNASQSHTFLLSEGLAELVATALAAAQLTDGLVDPTVGGALIAMGYDRDFSAIQEHLPDPPAMGTPVPGWASLELNGRLLRRPTGIVLDLGATAKGMGSDRSARAARSVMSGGGVLVSLGGDLAVAGQSPQGGWPILVSEESLAGIEPSGPVIRLQRGGVATSSVVCRRWRRGNQAMHHIIDPRTGEPVRAHWRTATVAAPTCAHANAASTALIVGGEDALHVAAAAGLPARLIGHDGSIHLIGSWPDLDGGQLIVPAGDPFVSRIMALTGAT
ncbi:MAG TPA: FAD:protein FMN transferase [Acidimicrobiales bacterium]|nr:FAD:protein FMN transferase [Acidimicrobiales bacterium]